MDQLSRRGDHPGVRGEVDGPAVFLQAAGNHAVRDLRLLEDAVLPDIGVVISDGDIECLPICQRIVGELLGHDFRGEFKVHPAKDFGRGCADDRPYDGNHLFRAASGCPALHDAGPGIALVQEFLEVIGCHQRTGLKSAVLRRGQDLDEGISICRRDDCPVHNAPQLAAVEFIQHAVIGCHCLALVGRKGLILVGCLHEIVVHGAVEAEPVQKGHGVIQICINFPGKNLQIVPQGLLLRAAQVPVGHQIGFCRCCKCEHHGKHHGDDYDLRSQRMSMFFLLHGR